MTDIAYKRYLLSFISGSLLYAIFFGNERQEGLHERGSGKDRVAERRTKQCEIATGFEVTTSALQYIRAPCWN